MATSRTSSIKTNYRLSPNEEATLIKEEKAKRRKLRIQQVREQERNFASKIRSNVSKKKEVELENLAAHLKLTWEREHKEKADALQRVYERSLSSVGDGHRAASIQPPLTEIRAAQSVKDNHAAKQRYSTALKKHQENKEAQYEKDFATIIARKSALQIEKVRAAKIASLPPPVKDPLDELDDLGKENKVVTVISGFSTSHYHLQGEYVERAEPYEQEDARLAAQEESRRVKEENEDAAREVKERHEKAHLRHHHARKQELLHQDYNKLMEELGHLEQADRRRRQAIVANIPHQVFQPPHKRLEDKLDEQQKLEQAFEDMYMANTDYTGDLVLALEPKPKGDADLDVTMDSVTDDVGISLQPLPPEMSEDAEARLPTRKDEETRLPRQIDEEARSSRRIDEEAGLPRRINEEARLSRRIDEGARLPRRIDEEERLLRRIDEEARLPRRIDDETRMPRQEDEEPRLLRRIDEEERLPRQIDEEARLPRRINEEARFPRGIDEEEKEQKRTDMEDEKPRQTKAPLKMLMNRIKSQREELKKKKVVLEIPSQESLLTEEAKFQGKSRHLQGPSSPSIDGSQTASESDRSTIDTLETGTMSEDNNKDQEMRREKEILLHPMERAAKIREALKMPDVESQKKTQQEIMAKEDSQRLRLAEQQLQDHIDHRDHLQLLQDNLLQRQLMLQQQVKEQELQHRTQLKAQQQDYVQQEAALWSKDLQEKHEMVKQQIELDNQRRQQQQLEQQGFAQQQAVLWKKELQKKQDMIKEQIEMDRQRRERKEQLQFENQQEGYRTDTRAAEQESLRLHQEPNQDPYALTQNQQSLNQQHVQQQHSQQQHGQQQHGQQQHDQQNDVTHYYDLPENLLQNQNQTLEQQHSPKQHQSPSREVGLIPHKVDLNSLDYRRTDPMGVQVAPKPFLQDARKALSSFQSETLPESRPVYRPSDSTSYPIPLSKIHQGHSMEWQRLHGHDPQGMPTSSQGHDPQGILVPTQADRDHIQLPSRDTLQEAQRSLQQRRERLMKEYPELQLPPYDPNIIDDTLTGPTSHTLPYTMIHPGEQTVRDQVVAAANLPGRGGAIHEVDFNDNILRASEATLGTGSASAKGAPGMGTGVSRSTQGTISEASNVMISSSALTSPSVMTKGLVTAGDLSTMRPGTTTEGAVTYPQSANVAMPSIAKLPSGISSPQDRIDMSSKRDDHSPLSQMERQLEQHRQILLKTRQQLQQEQQQQQQRILDKQRVLAQRIEQQRLDHLIRHQTTQPLAQNVMMSSSVGAQEVVTSQQRQDQLSRHRTQDVMMSSSVGAQEVVTSEQRQDQLSRHHTQDVMSQSLAQNMMMSSSVGAQGVVTSWQDEVVSHLGLMTSQVLPQDVMTQRGGAIALGRHGETLSEAREEPANAKSKPFKPSQSISSDTDAASVTDQINSLFIGAPSYKLPSITFGESTFQYRPLHGVSGESPQGAERPPVFHELSPESSENLTGEHLEDVSNISEDDETRRTEPVRQDWKTILASHPQPTPVQHHQPTLQSSRPLPARHPKPPPAPLRLPQTLPEAAPHELSTILEAESPAADHILRNYPPSSLIASTPHKTSPPYGDSQRASDAAARPFLPDYSRLTEEGSQTPQMAFTVDEVISKYTGHLEEQHHHVIASTIPSFAEDVGHGVLSYPASKILSTGPVSSVPQPPSSAAIYHSSHVPTPPVIQIAFPSTNNEGASPSADSQYSSSVSPLSDHTLRQTQDSSDNSLLSEGSVEKFLALSASEGFTSGSISSTSARYQPNVVIREKHSPIIKDFVLDVSSVSGWESSVQPTRTDEQNASRNTTRPRQSLESQEYSLAPVSPQSTWTDMDTQSGSYLNNEVPVLPMYRSDIPKNGMPMFSDVSLSYGNTSFESGQSVQPPSDVGLALLPKAQSLPEGEIVPGFNSGVSPQGGSEQWYVPQHSLDTSEFQQLGRDATPQENPDDTTPRRDKKVESGMVLRAEDDGKDDGSSKLSYAGALREESHDAIFSSDDTLQEAMRNIELSESETSKETGIIEEPDLTLVSLNTTMTSSVALDDNDIINEEMKLRQWESDNIGSDSLSSFLHHEEELSLESPVRTGSDRSGVDGSGLLLDKDQVLLTIDTSQEGATTLQEAFLRHKKSFIKSSHSRQQEVKVRTENQQATAFSQTLDNWKRARGGKVQRSTKPRTASSPSKGPAVKGQRSAARRSSQEAAGSIGQRAQTKDISKTVTASGRLSAEKEMYKRNVRLYNQLEEVQKQKLTKDRQKDYAANRQRRKEFEQKLHSRLQKLTKSSKPTS
ncbi:uncharacterized protein [Asterias amurensis]|uniref:uncharacterized protein n=1 Tax=Asterias amurensis TaxID=7602 RepID=UPI003AB57BA2